MVDTPVLEPQTEQRKPMRWHRVYFLLAGFDILAIAGSLYLSHQLMTIFRSSVEVNQVWADKLSDLSDLGTAAGAVNAPGNDVFDSHDVAGEIARETVALAQFSKQLSLLQRSIDAVPDAEARGTLKRSAERIDAAMTEMLGESSRIFADFRSRDAVSAGRRMATMDRKFAALSAEIAATAKSVREIQRSHFQAQVADAARLGLFEYVFAATIALMVAAALLYGRRISHAFRQSESERAAHTAQLEEVSERLRDAAVDATLAVKAKADFLATMSHEIRTPMNGVLGMSDVLLETQLTAEQRRAAKTIRESAEGLLNTLNDLVEFSSLEAGAIAPEEAPFDLHELLHCAVAIVRPRIQGKPIALTLTIGANVPRSICSDAGRVKQVVLNLLGNAAKFTERGSIALNASVTAGNMLRVEVCDTGIGIAAENLPLLFNSFQRADVTVARKFGGSGLGLAISKRLVELLRGRTGVESARKVGSSFWFEIPLVAAPSNAMDASYSAATVATGEVLAAQASDAPAESDPIVDWNALERFRADAGDDTLALLIDTYLSSTSEMLARFAAIARGEGDLKEALRIAHSIKSSSRQAGAPTLANLAAALEARAVEGGAPNPTEATEMARLFEIYRAALANKGMAAA